MEAKNELKLWPKESLVTSNTKIVRMKKKSAHHFQIADKPPTDLFVITDADVEEGQKRELQPIVSAWDVKVPQQKLKDYRNTGQDDSLEFWHIETEAIHKITVPEHITPPTPLVPLEVHRDPAKEEHVDSEHKEAHYGIQGLYRPEKIPRTYYTYLRSELNDLCTPGGFLPAETAQQEV